MEEKGKSKMKSRQLKRKGAAAVAAVLSAGMMFPSMAFAAGPVVEVASDSSVQMSSDPEAVYVNSYAVTGNFIWAMRQVPRIRHLMTLHGNR